jgi:hypothetical protein
MTPCLQHWLKYYILLENEYDTPYTDETKWVDSDTGKSYSGQIIADK